MAMIPRVLRLPPPRPTDEAPPPPVPVAPSPPPLSPPPPPPPPLPPLPEEIHLIDREANNSGIILTSRRDMVAAMFATHDVLIESDQRPSKKRCDPFQPDMPKVVPPFSPQFSNLRALRKILNINVDSTFFEDYKRIEKEFYSTHTPASEVYSTFKIHTIMDWQKRVYKKTVFEYTEYTIERKDGTISRFTDAELPHLNPYDLRFMLVYFGKKLDMGVECRVNVMRIKKALKDYIEHLSKGDMELSKSFGVRSNLVDVPLDTEIDEIEEYKSGTILQEPELGVVCTYENEKKFFRISEAQKFDNVTLQHLVDVVMNYEGNLNKGDVVDIVHWHVVDILLGHVNAREWVKECKKMVDCY